MAAIVGRERWPTFYCSCAEVVKKTLLLCGATR